MSRLPKSKVLVYQSIGFLAVIALSWADELLSLPAYFIQNHPHTADWREAVQETLVVCVVWFFVNRTTHKILSHLHELAAFMRVCAWCRRIHYKDKWMPMEDFFSKGFDTPTSHGICPECLRKEANALAEARKRREAGVK